MGEHFVCFYAEFLCKMVLLYRVKCWSENPRYLYPHGQFDTQVSNNYFNTGRSFCSYNKILINFGQLYSNSCYTTFSIATLGMCITCEFHQLWAVRPCIYHIFWHLTK